MNAIEVQNISKKYKLNHQKKDIKLKSYLSDIFSKRDQSTTEEFWALKDISFEVNEGDRLGIVGHNGAGKSTLLKILSRITQPTTGHVKIKGRMASLLEVGTGFHQELTGRENIFLNGAILGMKRREIESKFDEIVDFAGIEKFLDTPVKRYSSGMYVRLGFAVAAHLDPEILVIDEVLAVGDADFQRKCMGKMKDVSSSGRTLLFVSHNLTAVQSLCNKGIYMERGKILDMGDAGGIVANYLNHVSKPKEVIEFTDLENAPGNDLVKVRKLAFNKPSGINGHIDTRQPFTIDFEFQNYLENADINLSLFLYSMTGECVFNVCSTPRVFEKGLVAASLKVPGNFMNDGSYMISVMIVADGDPVFFYEEAINFEIIDYRNSDSWHGKWPGVVRPIEFDFPIWQKD